MKLMHAVTLPPTTPRTQCELFHGLK